MYRLLVAAFMLSTWVLADQISPYPQYGFRSWKAPVASSGSLSAAGNSTGDARVTKDDHSIYVWSGTGWYQISGGGGSTGATGASGANGTNGVNDTTGQTGATGQSGASGKTGATGASGADGSAGSAGAAGASGKTGATGASGASGATGLVGISGFGSSPSPSGLTLTNGILNMEPASGSQPGGVSTAAQTIAGQKTFSSSTFNSTGLVGDGIMSGKDFGASGGVISHYQYSNTYGIFMDDNSGVDLSNGFLVLQPGNASAARPIVRIWEASGQSGDALRVETMFGAALLAKIDSSGAFYAIGGAPMEAAFHRNCTITSAAAATAVHCLVDADVPSGKKVYLNTWRGYVNGATAWATTATCDIQDTNGTPVSFISIAVAAMTGNTFINDSSANVTKNAAYRIDSGGTAAKGIDIKCDANGTGSNFVVTIDGVVK